MKIEKGKFVSIHYTLKDEKGEVLDTSIGGEPLSYVHGRGYLIIGLENELEGKSPKDKFSATIKPEDAYGTRNEQLVVKVPRDRFDTDVQIEVGMQFSVTTPAGPTLVTVIKTEDDLITIDGNHELAGKTLYFDIEVVEVRDPTEDELARLELMNSGCGGCGGCGGSGECSGDCDGNCSGDGNCDCNGSENCNCKNK